MYLRYFLILYLISTASGAAFDPLQHSGPASPYFDAPSQDRIPIGIPQGCRVDQAAYILRHGTRYPEPGSFTGWQNLFSKFQNNTYTASGPLTFIPSWVPPVDDIPHEPLFLTSTGAREAFTLGVDLRKQYGFTKGGENFTVWSAGQQRCVDTATYFLRGYLSQGNYLTSPAFNRGHVVTLPDSVNFTFANSLTPSASCPNYSSGDHGSLRASAYRATYQSDIAKRLNRFLDGLTLDATDVGVMQDLCGFQAGINGDLSFCDIFQESEWLDYEYAHDLNYYYGSGPGNAFSATTGYPWVKAITDLFKQGPRQTLPGSSFQPPNLVMGFTHDNNLPPVISALGLWNTSSLRGVYPLSPTRPNSAREFRASYLVAFRGYVALERLTCSPSSGTVHHISGNVEDHKDDSKGIYVRVRVDNAPVAIPGCSSGPGFTCQLNSFIQYVEKRGTASGDFVRTCGLQNVPNATSEVSFLTDFPQSSVQLVGL